MYSNIQIFGANILVDIQIFECLMDYGAFETDREDKTKDIEIARIRLLAANRTGFLLAARSWKHANLYRLE